MSIFQVNQKIRIKNDIADYDKYRKTPFGINGQMRDLAGKEGVIVSVSENRYYTDSFPDHLQLDGARYIISCDNRKFVWPSCLLESVEEANEENAETTIKPQSKLLSIILRWRA